MPSLYPIHLPVFEGPLDLLLRLIEREELDITTVALAQVTDQYLARLAEMEQREAKELADFLVVAARLLLIKSLALLPSRPRPGAEVDTQDAGQDLVRQLQIYKRFKDVAARLREREEQGLHSYVRLVPLPRRDPQPDLSDVTLEDLLAIAQEALDVTPGPAVDEVVTPVTVTIADQIDHIERRLAERRQVAFHQLLAEAASRIEIIVTLLALLQLMKEDRVLVRQEQPFGKIIIKRRARSMPADAPATSSTT